MPNVRFFRRSSDNYGEDQSSSPQRRRGKFRILPLLLFVGFGLVYYFSNQQTVPITGRQQFVDIDRQTEIALGLDAYRQVLSGEQVVTSGTEAALVKDVGSKIAAVAENSDFNWEFNLIDSEQANAFCLPGGKVAVYSGILPIAQNADGLAAIIGHEIAHATARHGAERMAQSRLAELGQMAVQMSVSEMDIQTQRSVMGALGVGTQFGVLLPFSRKHESEADYIGLLYMARACFNPEEAPKLWERMAQVEQSGQVPEFISTHPSHATRIAKLKEWLPEALAERKKFCKD